MAAQKDTTIVISDEDTATDISEPKPPTEKALGKRKIEPVDFEVKEVWDADSDQDLPLFKKRKAQLATGRKGKGKAKPKAKGGKKATASGKQPDDTEEDEFDIAKVPEYLKERRKKFDDKRDKLRDAGLLLPPEYHDIVFPEDARGLPLERRPKFDESSKIKPCRPYKDVELEYSAGVIPASIAQYLRDYQIVGVKFLHRLFVYQRGGILGDDMGLGKTVQVASFLTAAFGKTADERDLKRLRKIRDEAGRWYPRVLIICPGSIIENWKIELDRWGWWKVGVFHGAGKEDTLASARSGRIEIMITTYTTYKNHESLVNTVKWDAVVADECHQIKERSSEITKAMNDVNALCRIGLTGTAIQNKYEELWTLLNWTNPGHFGTLSEWNNTITKPLKTGQSHDATLIQLKNARLTARKLVNNLLPGFFLRRMKTLIAHQLPKKTDRVVFCPLTESQQEAYKNFLSRPDVELLRTLSNPCACGSGKGQGWCCKKTIEDGTPWQSIIFPCVVTSQKLVNHLTLLVPQGTDSEDKHKREMRTLRDCCPDSWKSLYENRDAIMYLANPEFCGKWKVLKKLLRFWHEAGDKVLVFSHSVRLLRILQHLFHNTSYSVTYLDGGISYEDRQKAVDNFNSDLSQFVFLISTKAGGVGLNITSANKVVIVDPHWNPSYDLQAQDRAYRIGQVRDVDVFRLVSSGTIEEIVYARQIYKQQQANIGYTASSERRYFKGVQQDTDRKGEIFGLENLFTYHENQLVIRDIVNKTNIAEARVGNDIAMTTVDMDKLVKEEDLGGGAIKQEPAADAEDAGMSQLAAVLAAKNQKDYLDTVKSQQPKSDAVQAILSAAGVEYTHENSEVIGTSKVEEQLSRKAEMAASSDVDPEGDGALFADSQVFDAQAQKLKGFSYVYNPPEDVMRRQFCSMAKEFGFGSATEFALVVGSWTQTQRRNCLEAFYRIREGKLLAEETVKAEEEEVKAEVKAEGDRYDADFDAETEDESDHGAEAVKTEEVKNEPIKGVVGVVPSKAPIWIYDSDDDDEL